MKILKQPAQTPSQPRACGSCTMCCKTMEIHELEKPAGKWCPNCAIGKGCKIYETRPQGCRTFRCAWLDGAVPLELKPDHVRAVVTAAPRGIRVDVEPDRYDTVHKGPMGVWLEALARDGLLVTVACRGREQRYAVPAD